MTSSICLGPTYLHDLKDLTEEEEDEEDVTDDISYRSTIRRIVSAIFGVGVPLGDLI